MLRFLPILAALAPIVLSGSQAPGKTSTWLVVSGKVMDHSDGFTLRVIVPALKKDDPAVALRQGPLEGRVRAKGVRDALLKYDAAATIRSGPLKAGASAEDVRDALLEAAKGKDADIDGKNGHLVTFEPVDRKNLVAIKVTTDQPGITYLVGETAKRTFFELEPKERKTLNGLTFRYLRDIPSRFGPAGETANALPECEPAEDQTDQESKDAWQNNKWTRGTGLFLIPDPMKPGAGNFGVVQVCGLTYGQTQDKGANCVAFRWVADDVMSCDDIRALSLQSPQPCTKWMCPPNVPCAIPCICESTLCVGRWGEL